VNIVDQAISERAALEEELAAGLDVIESLMEERVRTADALVAHQFLLRHMRRK